MTKVESSIRERQRTDLREPRRYKVIIYNDDFTTMEFVVMILIRLFHKSESEAEQLMMQVHHEQLMMQVHHSGQGVVGIYTYDVAQSKVQLATAMAREEGFPLRLGCVPE